MKEREIVISIIEYLNRQDIFAWVVKTQGTFDPIKKQFRRPAKHYLTGQPDISAILPGGRYMGLEVKVKKGRVAPHQTAFLKRIEAAGGLSAVVRSVEDVIAILDGVS